jgi:hypothetical protein
MPVTYHESRVGNLLKITEYGTELIYLSVITYIRNMKSDNLMQILVCVYEHDACLCHISKAMRLKSRLLWRAAFCGLVSCHPFNLIHKNNIIMWNLHKVHKTNE